MRNFKDTLKATFLLLTLLVGINVIAQTDSLEVHTIKGKDYYIHIVQQGESLYFMHKKYDVPVHIIKKENPGTIDGLSIGEKVFIPVKRDTEVKTKANGNFINHTVKKKQTLYAIAKIYTVKQKEIIAANPELIDGLKEGEVIKIPVKEFKEEADSTVIKDLPKISNRKTHKVEKGETLYALSKKYNITVDKIKAENNGLTQGLKEGEIIVLPNDTVIIAEKDSILLPVNITELLTSDTLQIKAKKSEYTIGLMLPFYLDENDEMIDNRSALSKKSIYPKSKIAIEFYNGFLLALDSITTDSSQFKVFIYDTKGNDSLRIKNILLKPELAQLDLIVGPLFYNNFMQASAFAKANQIPIVSPVKQNNKLLLGNQFIFKAIPSKSTTLNKVSKMVVDSFKTDNLLAIEYEKAKEKALVDIYVKDYNAQLMMGDDTTIYSSVKVLKINTNLSDIVANLKMDKNNVIFVPASGQTFVTNLFNLLSNTLNKKAYKNYRVTLIGMEEWLKYENIDLEYFQLLNVHFCATKNIDYKNFNTNIFIKKHLETTSTYPSKNTFLGYDIAYYFGSALINNGSLFTPNSLLEYKGMAINFNFYKTGIESGFENRNSFLMKFEDYTLKRIE
ncbi:MAG: LysM peptidoglycan-binding domain-containing protein [Vicingaceae bacterium]